MKDDLRYKKEKKTERWECRQTEKEKRQKDRNADRQKKEKDRKDQNGKERKRQRNAENIGRTLCMEAFQGLFSNANVKDKMK